MTDTWKEHPYGTDWTAGNMYSDPHGSGRWYCTHSSPDRIEFVVFSGGSAYRGRYRQCAQPEQGRFRWRKPTKRETLEAMKSLTSKPLEPKP